MLLEYVDEAMAKGVYDKLEDGTYCGKIPKCPLNLKTSDRRRTAAG